MKVKYYSLFLSVLFLVTCSGITDKSIKILKDKNVIQKNESSQREYEKFKNVYSLKKNDNILIGTIYVKFINDTIFTDLYIINDIDTLYSIEKNILSNKNGKDIDVPYNNFYGYKFVIKRSDYFVLSYFQKLGKNVSDDIKIKWNYKRNIFEVAKTP